MSKKTKQTKKVLKGSKVVKEPKFKLVSYTMKAVIPTGQYANIQPEITVEAKTLEQAERAVMPYIETLFARYRDGGVKPIEPVRPVVAPVAQKPPIATTPVAQAPKPTTAPIMAPVEASKGIAGDANPNRTYATAKAEGESMMKTAPQAIVMTVPFTRAKGALDSCTSLAALKLVSDQVEKSTKLVDSEKVELRKLAETKLAQLNGKS